MEGQKVHFPISKGNRKPKVGAVNALDGVIYRLEMEKFYHLSESRIAEGRPLHGLLFAFVKSQQGRILFKGEIGVPEKTRSVQAVPTIRRFCQLSRCPTWNVTNETAIPSFLWPMSLILRIRPPAVGSEPDALRLGISLRIRSRS